MKAIVPTAIVGHKPSAKCDLSGRDNVECFVVRIGSGEPKCIAAKSLVETLRLTCSIVLKTIDRASTQTAEPPPTTSENGN